MLVFGTVEWLGVDVFSWTSPGYLFCPECGFTRTQTQSNNKKLWYFCSTSNRACEFIFLFTGLFWWKLEHYSSVLLHLMLLWFSNRAVLGEQVVLHSWPVCFVNIISRGCSMGVFLWNCWFAVFYVAAGSVFHSLLAYFFTSNPPRTGNTASAVIEHDDSE